ncbi:hypothetical protein, partial [Pseudomonas syringae group genomosp. 7]|uniref:hypothetical protein n=1 Tax=Pseudomonas syringae group genomosp. 7 TaxID=251699 RepID=UPI001C826D8E
LSEQHYALCGVFSVSWATLSNQESDMIVIPRSIALLASFSLITGQANVPACAVYRGAAHEGAMR